MNGMGRGQSGARSSAVPAALYDLARAERIRNDISRLQRKRVLTLPNHNHPLLRGRRGSTPAPGDPLYGRRRCQYFLSLHPSLFEKRRCIIENVCQ